MPVPHDLALGRAVVQRARAAIELAAAGAPISPLEKELPPGAPEGFRELRGVFVTLRSHPTGRLRGCIGFPLPSYPLHRALVRAAASAAREDPRFPPVRNAELSGLVVEVSLLSAPEPLPGPADQRDREVVVGRDGLIVEASDDYGLLLPQVAPEQGWDARRFLEGVCEKAGIPPDAWRRASTRVLRFTASVYREASPGGGVELVPSD